MNDKSSKLDDYINSHPWECLFILIMFLFFIFNILATFLATILYAVVLRKNKILPIISTLIGVLLISFYVYLEFGQISIQNFILFLKYIWQTNWFLLKKLYVQEFSVCWEIFIGQFGVVTIDLSLLIAGLLALIDLIPKTVHVEILKDMQKGLIRNDTKELTEKQINKKLAKLKNVDSDGIQLGVSTYTGSQIIMPDRFVNQVVLVLGTTGSGKTITLNRFYQRAIQQGYPLVIIDGKPDDDNIRKLSNLARQHNRKFYGFNCENYYHYDPLSDGGHTELKDKIISLKDEWSSDYYRSIAEDCLQTTFEVLLKSKLPLNLKQVVNCLDYEELSGVARSIADSDIKKRVEYLENYRRDDITGLQAHLNILINSELGQYFDPGEDQFTLTQVINEGGIVYFALPALRFPSFAKVLGKLVINDLKAIIDRTHIKEAKIFTVFDEFSVFAGEQVLNLVNMGRGKSVHAVFGTQGLADLEKIDTTFKNQFLNCANTLICHRLNDKDSAETVAEWIGTKDNFTLTAQLNLKEQDNTMGSVRVNKEFIIHPDEIKQRLRTGEAFYVTKVGGFGWDKVRVKFS